METVLVSIFAVLVGVLLLANVVLFLGILRQRRARRARLARPPRAVLSVHPVSARPASVAPDEQPRLAA